VRGGPLYAIKKYCLWCCGDNPKEVKLCPVENCPLYPLREGKKPKEFKGSVLKAIKMRCFDCSDFDWKRLKECEFKDCPLYPYRLGKNPNLKGKRKNNIAQNGISKEEEGIKPLLEEENSKIVQ